MAASRSTPSASRPLRVLFAAGGTGGHVYPALAIADALKALRPDAEITFAGTAGRLEAEAVPKAGYRFLPVSAVALPRTLSPDLLRLPFRLAGGLRDARRVVKAVRPHVAVGTGGYVTGPVLAAAKLAGVPFVLQEQNAFAGVTNRLLGRFAAEVHVAFEEAKAAFPAGRALLTGNPVRGSRTGGSRREARQFFGVPEGVPVLVVTGGSLGAQKLNEVILAQLPAMLGDAAHAVWITGPRYYERTRLALGGVDGGERVHLVSYLDRMELAYAVADLFLCRAGAITLAELALTGTPSVLVPSPNVAEDHQTHNARSFERVGAAVLLPEAELDAKLAATIHRLLHDPERLAAMGAAAETLARPDAAADIARHALALAS